MIVSILTAAFVSSVLLYMHKMDPSYSIPIVFLVSPFTMSVGVYFAILMVIGIIEDRSYRSPDFLFYLALYPAMFNFLGLVYGVLYALPMLLIYYVDEYYGYKRIIFSDLRPFMLAGLFFTRLDVMLPFYILFIVLLLPYSLSKKKLVPLSPVAILSIYLLYLVI